MRLPPKVFYPFVKLSAKIFGRFNLEETSPIQAVKNAKVPIIFMHGTDDKMVPCQMSINLYENCNNTKKLVLIENAGHGIAYLVDPLKYINELNDFYGNAIYDSAETIENIDMSSVYAFYFKLYYIFK